MSKLDVTKKMWEAEVEAEEIKLIERGVPPGQAADRAIEIVSSKRRAEYADKCGG